MRTGGVNESRPAIPEGDTIAALWPCLSPSGSCMQREAIVKNADLRAHSVAEVIRYIQEECSGHKNYFFRGQRIDYPLLPGIELGARGEELSTDAGRFLVSSNQPAILSREPDAKQL